MLNSYAVKKRILYLDMVNTQEIQKYKKFKKFFIPDQNWFQEEMKTNCSCKMDWLHIFSELESFLEFAITYFTEQELDYYTTIDGKSVALSEGIKYYINKPYLNPCETWDDLWCNFYMYKVHNKVWNNGWIDK